MLLNGAHRFLSWSHRTLCPRWATRGRYAWRRSPTARAGELADSGEAGDAGRV